MVYIEGEVFDIKKESGCRGYSVEVKEIESDILFYNTAVVTH